jgi:[methyl-Co(III) methanol-specific corrinoid protein]:coenzyme M methyltransferase
MGTFTETERLLRVLGRKPVDRPPVISTGGMMNAAVKGIMEKTGHTLPEAHFDSELMAALAFDIHKETGFENFGIPFCMTVEAEVLGSSIEMGSLSCEPKIRKEHYPSVSAVEEKDGKELLSSGRIRTVIDAIRRLSAEHPDIPVIGTLTGPISLAASVVDPMNFYRELRKDRENAHRALRYVSAFLGRFALEMAAAGAHVIAIGDPSATGEILGPLLFGEYAVPYLNEVIDIVHGAGKPVILHICGDLKPVRRLIPALKADAISTDAVVNLKGLKDEFPDITTMGNVSTYLLEFGEPESVAKKTRQLVLDGVNIISPACGLSTSTSLDRIRAITETVKEHNGAR